MPDIFDQRMRDEIRLFAALVIFCALVAGIVAWSGAAEAGAATVCVDGYCTPAEAAPGCLNVTVALVAQNSGDRAAENVEAVAGLYCGGVNVYSHRVVFGPVPAGQAVTNTSVVSLALSPSEIAGGDRLELRIDEVDVTAQPSG